MIIFQNAKDEEIVETFILIDFSRMMLISIIDDYYYYRKKLKSYSFNNDMKVISHIKYGIRQKSDIPFKYQYPNLLLKV